ncbi:MAG: matrixin family metalloprotease, partial [Candidatus Eisenbacteria bacterium]
PVFLVGETVDVGLAATRNGWTVAEGADAVVRLAPAPGGGSGARVLTAGSAGVDTTLAPQVVSVDPELSGASADQTTIVTVRGARFGAEMGEGRVTFQGLFERIDAPVVSWTDDLIRCRVPAPGLLGVPQVLTGALKVWTPAGGWSDGSPFVGGPRFRVLYQWAGDAWRTGNLPVPVYLNPDGFPWGAAAGPVVARALERWNVPGSYARLVYRGLTQAEAGPHRANGARSGDDRNTVRWRTSWPHNPAWLAVTWSRIDTVTYERQETDLEINGDQYRWSLDAAGEHGAWDLPSTLAHEFGHWLRLGHTQSIASVMLPSFGAGDLRRDLSPSDGFGASWIYPAYGTIEAPTAVASGTALDLRVRVRDREGRERPGLPAADVVVRALPLVAGATPPGPLDPALGMPSAATISADAAADAEGWTTARLAGLADGAYRIEVFVEGSLVRPVPLLTVGVPPAIGTPALALAGVSPQPLPGGVRGTVRFTLPQAAHVELALYDVRGARTRILAAERFAAGAHEVPLWTRGADGTRLSAGVYFLRLSSLAGASFAPLTARVVVLP